MYLRFENTHFQHIVEPQLYEWGKGKSDTMKSRIMDFLIFYWKIDNYVQVVMAKKIIGT